MDIGQKLTFLREKKKLTQQQFADILGIKRSRYSGWESNSNEPPAEMLVKIADYYHVNVDYILGRNDSMTQEQQIELQKILEQADNQLKYHFSEEEIWKIRTTIMNNFYDLVGRTNKKETDGQ